MSAVKRLIAVADWLPCISCGANMVTKTRRGAEIGALEAEHLVCATCYQQATLVAREVTDGAISIEADEGTTMDVFERLTRGHNDEDAASGFKEHLHRTILSMAMQGYLGNSMRREVTP